MVSILCNTQRSSPAGAGDAVSFAPLAGLSAWEMARLDTAERLASCWPAAERADDFWLRSGTLEFLNREPQGFATQGILLRNKHSGHRILLTLQIFKFSAAGNVREEAKGDRSPFDLRRKLLSPFAWRVAAVGQFLTSGDYAQDGLNEVAEKAQLLGAVSRALLRGPERFYAVIIKDCCRKASLADQHLCADAYYSLPVDPVMELRLDAAWANMDDYLGSITSKYRVRYRRARAKFSGLRKAALSAEEVAARSRVLFELYGAVKSGADYNAADLTEAYFPWLARTQAQRCGASGFTGYWDGEVLVGYTTTVANGPVLHAHYLGMDQAYNGSHHLYHNMLFDLLEMAIERRAEVLDYGRTALEIKSSVGAVPTQYSCLIRGRNRVLNTLIPIFTPAVYSVSPWQARSPFKKP